MPTLSTPLLRYNSIDYAAGEWSGSVLVVVNGAGEPLPAVDHRAVGHQEGPARINTPK